MLQQHIDLSVVAENIPCDRNDDDDDEISRNVLQVCLFSHFHRISDPVVR